MQCNHHHNQFTSVVIVMTIIIVDIVEDYYQVKGEPFFRHPIPTISDHFNKYQDHHNHRDDITTRYPPGVQGKTEQRKDNLAWGQGRGGFQRLEGCPPCHCHLNHHHHYHNHSQHQHHHYDNLSDTQWKRSKLLQLERQQCPWQLCLSLHQGIIII